MACSPFVGIVNVLQADVLFVLEEAVKFRMMAMETELGEEERCVGLD
jgi:hypothetical protein